MVNWTSKFDPSTGNFNISANFVGFQQAFLNDLTMGDIVGAVNTEIGSQMLKQLKMGPNKDMETPTIDSFVKTIAELQRDLEALKIEEETYKELIILNTQLNKIKSIGDFIGTPIEKENSDTTTGSKSSEYYKKPNNPDVIQTRPIISNNLQIMMKKRRSEFIFKSYDYDKDYVYIQLYVKPIYFKKILTLKRK